jgi:Mg/Co/Ni transporter MgtE
LPTTAELPPLPEPYNPLADPVMKEALDIMSIANSIVDEVVDKLLNEATEKILKED